MNRRFQYAGCLGSPWKATNGLFQSDPLTVVILNCVLCPLLTRLSQIPDLSVYAFADDLTVSSSWKSLNDAFTLLQYFCNSTDLVLNLSHCQLWNKGSPLKFLAQNGRARAWHKPSFCAGKGFAQKMALGSIIL